MSAPEREPDPLAQCLADALGDAAVLRRHKQTDIADAIEALVEKVRAAAEDFLTFLPESHAVLRSGHAVPWLRHRYAAWAASGHAYTRGGVRFYRAVILPQRGHVSAALEEGREAGRRSA